MTGDVHGNVQRCPTLMLEMALAVRLIEGAWRCIPPAKVESTQETQIEERPLRTCLSRSRRLSYPRALPI